MAAVIATRAVATIVGLAMAMTVVMVVAVVMVVGRCRIANEEN
jgi:hypothetical protein